MIDGGRVAIRGFLYQILGAAWVSARAWDSNRATSAMNSSRRIASPNDSIVHEQSDMDVVVLVSGTSDAHGVQFKHSNSPSSAVQADELIQILDGFYRSSAQFMNLTFTSYFLITNRRLAPRAQSLYGTRNQDSPDIKLTPKAGGKAAEKAIKLYGDANTAANARHAILAKLNENFSVSQEDFTVAVKSHASSHGVLPTEFEEALERLVGRIFDRTAGVPPVVLDSKFLNECLLGAPDARSLAVGDGPDSARAAAGKDLETFISEKLVDKEETLIRRRLIEEVEKQVSMRSLVFVVGQGGSGKSVLAAQYLRNESATRFVAAESAGRLNDEWLGRLLREWRSPGCSLVFPIEQIEKVVDRLCHANPLAPRPILVLDLDGIDEIPLKDRLTVWRLIDRFRRPGSEPASAVLLVTARIRGTNQDEEIKELIRDCIQTDRFSIPEGIFGRVVVGDFGKEELGEAARLLGDDYIHRLEPTLGVNPLGDLASAELGGENFESSPHSPVSPAIVESLRHPAMWGSFVSLLEQNRLEIMDGVSGALDHLARRFLDRFSEKTHRRRPALTPERVCRALADICKASSNHSAAMSRTDHWIVPARGPVTDDEAAYLLDEAVSYGLVIEDPKGVWMWRHGFVRDHLRGG